VLDLLESRVTSRRYYIFDDENRFAGEGIRKRYQECWCFCCDSHFRGNRGIHISLGRVYLSLPARSCALLTLSPCPALEVVAPLCAQQSVSGLRAPQEKIARFSIYDMTPPKVLWSDIANSYICVL